MDFRAPLPSSSTDHIANIVSESQAWKIDCRHHQLLPVLPSASPFRINFSSFGEPASRFSAIERAGNWKKVREQVLEYGWMQLEETLQMYKKACSRGNHNSFGGASLEELYLICVPSRFTTRQLDDQGK
jgi:hypothetical protein